MSTPMESNKMVAPESAVLDDRLDELNRGYLRELPRKLTHLQSLWEKLLFVNWEPEAFALMRRLVHGMAGAAGTHGLREIGQIASGLNRMLDGLADQQVPPSDIQRGQINGALQHLAAAILDEKTHRVSHPRREAQAPIAAPGAATRRLYLLEDDCDQAIMLAARFGHYGYAVRWFTRPDELRQEIAKQRPDLILCDVMLPQGSMGGIQVIQELRSEFGEDLPVIFLSARGDLTARLAAVRAGCSGYFLKPLDFDELVRRVDELMQRHISPYRILIVEDEEQLAGAYSLVLQQAGLKARVLSRPLQILQVLHEFQPDLVVMDLYLPECTGIELMQLIRQDPANITLPVIFLSAEMDPDAHNSALTKGADLFLLKPIKPDQLVSVIVSRVGRARSLTQRMRFLAQQDPLTGLLNQRAFLGYLDQHVAELQGGEMPASLLFIEVDQVRTLRERLGITAADLLLADLAARIKDRLYRAVRLSHLSEGAFCALMVGMEVKDVCHLAQTLCKHIAADLFTATHESVSLTLSIGVAPIDSRYREGSAWMSAAGVACDIARESGGNRMELHREAADDLAVQQQHSRCVALIRSALVNNGFHCLFQPIASLRGKPIERYDVLLRARDPDGREVSAARIINVARSEGMLTAVDRWVVRHVVRNLQRLAVAGAKTVFFVKLSSETLNDPEFASWLEQLLNESGVSGRQLVFEFSEQGVETSVRAAAALFGHLRRLGCGTALEHFGSSLSGPQLLTHLPVDYVKIDGSFVRDLVSNPANRDSVRSILRQAGEAGAMVIAGFVEDAASLSALWQCGVHFIQGNFLQEPDERLSFDFSDELHG